MSQAAATKLISKLRFKLHDRRRLRNVDGPKGRHDKIKKTLTALLKHERIELNYHRGDETRGYAERLISEAIRNGACHKETMEMASYWIIEPPIVHKLFKVLAPRYANFEKSYTKLWRSPNIYPGHGRPKCVLELRDNIYPSLEPDKSHNKNLIHNVLLEEAKKVYRKNKAEMAAKEQQIISESEASKSETKSESESTIDGIKYKSKLDDGGSETLSKEEKAHLQKASMAAKMATMEQRIISESKARISETKGNVQSEPSIGVNNDESKLAMEDSKLPENLKTDSASKGESEVKSAVDLPLEADLDKMKITEEKPPETLSDDKAK